MEERKRQIVSHWITPDVFIGEVQYAVGQSNYVKRVVEIEPPEPSTEPADVKWQELINELEELKKTISQLETYVMEQQAVMDSLKKYVRGVEETQAKERAHLYQVVLSLKQEWETLK